MSYKTNFTITPPCEWMKSAYLRPVDVIGKIDDGHRCCVISRGDFWIAKHKGGSFFSSGLSKRLPAVTEATPIPTESQWPKGCEWSEDDWTERGIHPPRPVQDAILIVTMPNGRIYEVTMPFTDERPGVDADERERYLHEFKLALQVMRVKRIYGVERSAIRWAWEV